MLAHRKPNEIKEGPSFFDMIKRCVSHDLEYAGIEPTFDHKYLERSIVFFGVLSGTYPSIRPRLKGFHHTLNSWRGYRDEDGWK